MYKYTVCGKFITKKNESFKMVSDNLEFFDQIVSSGTVNSGTVNSGTVNSGTVNFNSSSGNTNQFNVGLIQILV